MIIYFDMDGVLANFYGRVQELTGKKSPEKKELWAAVNKEPEFFTNLDPFKDTVSFMNVLIDQGHNVHILTATGNNFSDVMAQKMKFFQKHCSLCPVDKIHFVKSGLDKTHYASPSSILIDDNEKVIEAWKAAGGIGILHNTARETINKFSMHL